MAALFSSVAMTTIATPPPRCLQQHHSCLKPAQKEDVIILDQQRARFLMRPLQGDARQEGWDGFVNSLR